MLRKEILGTKVRTELGLNKPLTLAKPNNDEDYKNLEFLDTDILLAKDIKRFVKGGETGEDTFKGEYIILSSVDELGNTNAVRICSINKEPLMLVLSEYIDDSGDHHTYDVFSIKEYNGYYNVYPKFIPTFDEVTAYEPDPQICVDTTPSIIKNICIQIDSDTNNNFHLNSIGEYTFNSGDNKLDIDVTTYWKKHFTPLIDRDKLGKWRLHSITGISNDNGYTGYYKSDGTITSVENLKTELGITDDTIGNKPLISYIGSSEDTSVSGGYELRNMLGVSFTAYVNNVGNTGSFTVGAYCSASDDYKPSRYAILKKDVGYNDTFIFPMFNINSDNNHFTTLSIDYTLRNIAGIKSDDGNIGYYCSDGTVTTLDDLRTAIGTDVNISNTSTITLSQEGKSSTANLAYSGITLNQYLTSSTNHGLCKGNISGGALRLIRAYTDASGVTDLSNPDYTIYLKTDDASIRGYDKNNNGYVLTNRNLVVTIDGNDVTLNVPLLYLSGNDNNRFLATGDHLAIGDFKTTENVNNARLFIKEYVGGSYKTGLLVQGFSNNNTLPVKVGLFINNEENNSTRCGVFMENKTQNDLITANGGTKAIGVDIAAQSSITELQSQIEALTARIAALEAKL